MKLAGVRRRVIRRFEGREDERRERIKAHWRKIYLRTTKEWGTSYNPHHRWDEESQCWVDRDMRQKIHKGRKP
jgi:hypothetical protein